MRRSLPLALVASLVSTACFVVACGDDDPAPVPAARAGSGGSSAGAGGSAAGAGGSTAGAGGSTAGAGGSTAGAGGTSAGAGGTSAGAGGTSAAGAAGTAGSGGSAGGASGAAGSGGSAGGASGAGGSGGAAASNIWRTLVFTGTGFAVHETNKLAVSVIRADTGEVVAGKILPAQSGDTFLFTWPGLLAPGVSYHVDYYADLSKNQACDAPATDHVWRKTISGTDSGALTVMHDSAWTDQCPSFTTLANRKSLTFKGTEGFVVHQNQRIEVVVTRAKDGKVIAHAGTPKQEGDGFSFTWDGLLEQNEVYTLDYYADNNNNGACNPPADDHVWRENIPAVTADVAISVKHTSNWVDVCSSFSKLRGRPASCEHGGPRFVPAFRRETKPRASLLSGRCKPTACSAWSSASRSSGLSTQGFGTRRRKRSTASLKTPPDMKTKRLSMPGKSVLT